MFRSVQDGNEIHSHAVTTNKEAFMRKKIDKKRHLKNRKLKQQKKKNLAKSMKLLVQWHEFLNVSPGSYNFDQKLIWQH